MERFLPLRATSRCATRTPTSRSTTSSRSRRLGLIKAIDRFDPAAGRVHELRRAHDPGRAQAPLPRQGLVAARAARPAGARACGRAARPRSSPASSAARRACARWRGPRLLGRAGARGQEAAASYEAASLDAPAAREDDEAAALVDAARARGRRLRAGRGAATRSPAPGGRCPSASARCCGCASCRT